MENLVNLVSQPWLFGLEVILDIVLRNHIKNWACYVPSLDLLVVCVANSDGIRSISVDAYEEGTDEKRENYDEVQSGNKQRAIDVQTNDSGQGHD